VLHHLGIPRDIYRGCTINPIYQFTFKVLSQYLNGTFWSVTELSFLWILLEVRGRYLWGGLWCWRYLCGTSEPEVWKEIWVLLVGPLRISCILS